MSHKAIDIGKTYLITGAAGFIGYYLSEILLGQGNFIIGVDNLNDYYDVKLKNTRLNRLKLFDKFTFIKADISAKETIEKIIQKYRPNIVVNLAAQAGVRYSMEKPDSFISSNIIGFYNILEACRLFPVEHLVFASSSSVYGSNNKLPFEESDSVDRPLSLYAATKKSNELMAYTYSHLYKIPTTGLRFFTVYGPLGRPDMAYFSFTRKYFAGEPIHIYNNGDFENDLYRDFTYIDDVVDGIAKVLSNPPSGQIPNIVYNMGNNKPEKLMKFIIVLEKALSNATGKNIVFNKIFEPIKPGDVRATFASIDLINQVVDFKPTVSIDDGLKKFADWYIDYYRP